MGIGWKWDKYDEIINYGYRMFILFYILGLKTLSYDTFQEKEVVSVT